MAKKKLEALAVIHDFPDWILHDSQAWAGRWPELFGRKAPLHLDIGMGFGTYLIKRAEAEPHRNFLGIERQPYRVIAALKKAQARGLTNVRFLCGKLEAHLPSFGPGEVDEITLLFPDPWPAGSKRKHRMTYPTWVELYHRLLRVGGKLIFRTDHPWLYDFSKPVFDRQGFQLTEELEPDRILTDFETRYLAEGRAIYAIECKVIERSHDESRIDAAGAPGDARRGAPLHDPEPEPGSAPRGVQDGHRPYPQTGKGQLPAVS